MMRLACIAFCWVAMLAAQPRDYRKSAGYAAYEKANALFVAGKYQQAFDSVDEALKRDPGLTPALTLKAKLALSANRYDVAREVLGRAIAAEPGAAYARFLLGFTLHMRNEMPQALVELEKAQQLDPKDARATLYLGLTHESLGHVDQALKSYEETIRLENAAGKPQADTLLTYARFLMVLGRQEDAGKRVDQALKLRPDSRDAHYERARLLLRQGNAAGAAAAGERALGLAAPGVTDRQIHYLLVKAYQLSGQEDLAAKHAEILRRLEKPSRKP
jgi:tetratricopeptide (TPR) repeat protein